MKHSRLQQTNLFTLYAVSYLKRTLRAHHKFLHILTNFRNIFPVAPMLCKCTRISNANTAHSEHISKTDLCDTVSTYFGIRFQLVADFITTNCMRSRSSINQCLVYCHALLDLSLYIFEHLPCNIFIRRNDKQKPDKL